MSHDLDIVIPARNEEITLGYTLRALLCEASDAKRFRIIVVINGSDQVSVRRTAERFAPAFEEAGVALVILATNRSGKAAALNIADDWRDAGRPVIYLDADCILLPQTLAEIKREVSCDRPVVATAPLRVVPPRSFTGRSYFRIWSKLPNVSERPIGAGCYALSAKGRSRWQRFPEGVADDVFVFDNFAACETLVAGRGKLFVSPDGVALLEAVKRWAQPGVRSMRVYASNRRRSLSIVGKNPALVWHLPTFLTIKALGHIISRATWPAWEPHRHDDPPAPNVLPTVRVVIVTYNSANWITACIDAIVSRWAKIDIVVVDNASSDRTLDLLDSLKGQRHLRVIRNSENAGFARAANQAANLAGEFDYVLMLNPDVILSRGAIDTLLALAFAAPSARLYGGQMNRPDGVIDPSSCLARPSLYSAALFAGGLSAMRGHAVFDPDSLGGWKRDEIRRVPVLTGGVLLVEGALWRHLGGFDETFFLYSEDSDLALRATQADASSIFIPDAFYTHYRGASHADTASMKIHTLRGKCQYYRKHSSLLRARLAISLLFFGVALRARLSPTGSDSRKAWSAAMHRSREWL